MKSQLVSTVKIKYPKGLHNMCFEVWVTGFPGKAQLKSQNCSHMQPT